MKFYVCRSSQGEVSKKAPCSGATRGLESPAWPGEYQWTIEVDSLEALVRFVEQQGGGLGVFAPEEGEEHPTLQIFDEEEEE